MDELNQKLDFIIKQIGDIHQLTNSMYAHAKGLPDRPPVYTTPIRKPVQRNVYDKYEKKYNIQERASMPVRRKLLLTENSPQKKQHVQEQVSTSNGDKKRREARRKIMEQNMYKYIIKKFPSESRQN